MDSNKENMWGAIRTDVDQITDGLGLAVDEEIKETVVAFLAHGFTTSQSCGGHANTKENYGVSSPWVEVYSSEPKGWRAAKAEKKKAMDRSWKFENIKQQNKMTKFLAEFNEGRVKTFQRRLIIDPIGAFGGFRVQSFGAEKIRLLPQDEQLKILEIYRKEMVDFTNFLRHAFFEN